MLASGERGCLPDDAGQKEIVLKTADIRDISRYGQKKVLLMCIGSERTEPSGFTFHVRIIFRYCLTCVGCSLRQMERATFISGARPKVLEEEKKAFAFFPPKAYLPANHPERLFSNLNSFFPTLAFFPTKGTFLFSKLCLKKNWSVLFNLDFFFHPHGLGHGSAFFQLCVLQNGDPNSCKPIKPEPFCKFGPWVSGPPFLDFLLSEPSLHRHPLLWNPLSLDPPSQGGRGITRCPVNSEFLFCTFF